MNKVELLQEKYNAKKNDMSKEELLEFNEHLFKSFLSDKEANDDVFWAYSEITDRVIEDLKEKNEKLLNNTSFELNVNHYKNKSLLGPKESEINETRTENEKLKKEVSFFKQLSFANGLKFNDAKKDINKLEKDLVRERSISNQLSLQVESQESDIAFFRHCIKEQRGIVIDEVVKLLEKESGSYSSIFKNSEIRIIKRLKNKIKEMGNK